MMNTYITHRNLFIQCHVICMHMSLIYTHRRFDHHSRPTFGEIVAMLSGANECELTVSDANVENSELAAHLGAPLGSAVGLYSDLRHSQ